MDLDTFGRQLCDELSVPSILIPTGIWYGSEEIALAYYQEAGPDVLVGGRFQLKPDLARRMFLRLRSGFPSLGTAQDAPEQDAPEQHGHT